MSEEISDGRKPIKLEFERCRNRWIDRAQRYAVLAPLTGGRFIEQDEVFESMRRLHRRRTARIFSLRKGGWMPMRAENYNLVYALRCPPFGVISNNRAKPCGRSSFCPYCWAREFAGDAFRRLEWAYYGSHRAIRLSPTGKLEPIAPRRYDLVEINFASVYTDLDEAFSVANQARKLVKLVPGVGAYSLGVVEPDNGKWKTTCRVMSMVPMSFQPDGAVPGANKWSVEIKKDYVLNFRRHYSITGRGDLAGTIGRVCRYPSGLMAGKPADTVAVLEAKQRYRLSVYYGLLRNRAERIRLDTLEQPE